MSGNITRINNNQITDAVTGNVELGIDASAKIQANSITANLLAANLVYGSNLTICGNLSVANTISTAGNICGANVNAGTIQGAVFKVSGTTSGVHKCNIFGTAFVEDVTQAGSPGFYLTGGACGLFVFGGTQPVHVETGCHSWTFGTNGTLSAPGNIISANFTTTGAQGNIFGANVISGVTLTATGNVYGAEVVATYLHGDGSNISNIVPGTQIVNGNTNVSIAAPCSAVTMAVNAIPVFNLFAANTFGGARSSFAIGANAGQTSQGVCSIAVGTNAGQSAQGGFSVAIGSGAGQLSQGPDTVAIGVCAGQSNQGPVAVAIGGHAGISSQGAAAVAIGISAGSCNQGQAAVAIGACAGIAAQSACAIAIGTSAAGNPLTAFACNVAYCSTSITLPCGVRSGTFVPGMTLTNPACSASFGTGVKVVSVSTVCSIIVLNVNQRSPSQLLCIPLKGSLGQQSNAIAIGTSAGAQVQGNSAIAIGQCAGAICQMSGAIAIGICTGHLSQAGCTVAIGNGAGRVLQKINAVAIGACAGAVNQGHGAIAIGHLAGCFSQSNNTIILNASCNPLNGVACQTSSFYVDPIRCATSAKGLFYNPCTREVTYSCAASGGVGNVIVCGSSNVAVRGSNVTMQIGNTSSFKLNAAGDVAIGTNAGLTCQQICAIAIGTNAGSTCQHICAIAIGSSAGQTSQGGAAVAIGRQAGQCSQHGCTVAIGVLAGQSCQGCNSVAVGVRAGQISQGGDAVAIGIKAGEISQQNNAVAIGKNSGATCQQTNAVAVGTCAGHTNQGAAAVAIGIYAGCFQQSSSAIAIGACAAYCNQGASAIAIGVCAGAVCQKNNAIAIGTAAGLCHQGQYTVAIGYGAGRCFQACNTIILNASGCNLNGNACQPNSFYVAPIRTVNCASANVLYYDTVSKEITSGPLSSSYGNANVETLLSSGTVTTDILTTGNVSAGGNVDGTNLNLANGGGLTSCGPFTVLTPNTSQPCSTGIYVACGSCGIQLYGAGNTNVLVYAGAAQWTFDFTGQFAAPGNILGYGNILATNSSSISTAGNVYGAYLHGCGANITGLPAGYSNANVATYLSSGTVTTDIITTGNVSAGGNITAANYITTGTQGNIYGANVISGITLSASGNVYGTNIIGSYLYGDGSNITGGYGNANVSAFLGCGAYSGNIVTTGLMSTSGAVIGGSIGIGRYSHMFCCCTLYFTSCFNIKLQPCGGSSTLCLSNNGVSSTGNVYGTNIIGSYLYGDGSNITNLSNLSVTSLVNGTSNVVVANSGNITITAVNSANAWTFDNAGNLTSNNCSSFLNSAFINPVRGLFYKPTGSPACVPTGAILFSDSYGSGFITGNPNFTISPSGVVSIPCADIGSTCIHGTVNINCSHDLYVNGGMICASFSNIYGGNMLSNNYFYANGSPINTSIVNGTSSVNIATACGPIAIGVGGSNVFVLCNIDSTFTGNLNPSANATYSLGNSTNQWKSLHVSNTTIYIGCMPIGVTNNQLTFNCNPIVTANATGTSTTTGNLSVTGSVAATYLYGCGANITGISGGSTFANTVGSFGSDMGIGPNYALDNPAVLFSEDDMVIRTGGTASAGGQNYGQMDIAASESLNIGLAANLADATNITSYLSSINFAYGGTAINVIAGTNYLTVDATTGLTYNGAPIAGCGSYSNANVAAFMGTFGSNAIVWGDNSNIFVDSGIHLYGTYGADLSSAANVGINANIGGTLQAWTFGNDGNLSAPGNISTLNSIYADGGVHTTNINIDAQGAGNTYYIAANYTCSANTVITAGNLVTTSVPADQLKLYGVEQDAANIGYPVTFFDDSFAITGYTFGGIQNDHSLIATDGNINIVAGLTGCLSNTAYNEAWKFDTAGNLTLPRGGIVYETNIPGNIFTGNTIALTPAGGTSADQQLLIYPTVGADNNHLHLTSGNLYNTELFLGNDDLYVKLANTGDIVINTNDNRGNTAQWLFDTRSALTLPPGDASYIQSADNREQIYFNQTANSFNIITNATYEFVFGGDGTVAFGGGYVFPNVNGNTGQVLVADNTGILTWQDQAAATTSNSIINGTSNVTIPVANGNVTINANTASWTFDTNGALNLPAATGPGSDVGYIQTANAYPSLLAYGSGGHGGPELDWMNTDDPANTFSSDTTIRNSMWINNFGLYVGINENGVANVYQGNMTFDPTGNLNLPGNVNFPTGAAVTSSVPGNILPNVPNIGNVVGFTNGIDGNGWPNYFVLDGNGNLHIGENTGNTSGAIIWDGGGSQLYESEAGVITLAPYNGQFIVAAQGGPASLLVEGFICAGAVDVNGTVAAGVYDLNGSNTFLASNINGTWSGTVGNSTDTVGFFNTSATGSQLVTFASSAGQMSLQTDGSLFLGDGLGASPFGLDATSVGYVVAQGGIYSNGAIIGSQLGNAATYLYGCGANITGITANTTYNNSNVATYLSSGTVSTDILTTGNVSAGGNITATNYITTGTQGNIYGANVISGITLTATGNVYGTSILGTGDISATGNIHGSIFNINGSTGGVKQCGIYTALVEDTAAGCSTGVYLGPSSVYVYGGPPGYQKPIFIGNPCHFVEVDTSGDVIGPGWISAVGNVYGNNIVGSYLYGCGANITGIPSLTGATTGCGACQNTVLGVGAGGSHNSVVLGYNASTFNGGGTGGEVIIGAGATGTYGGSCSVVIGKGATLSAGATQSVIIGACSTSASQLGIAIGFRAHAAASGIAIGLCTTAAHAGFYVAPVRCATTAGGSPVVVGYCSGTREFVYGLSTGGGCYGNANVAAYLDSGTVSTDIITTGNVGTPKIQNGGTGMTMDAGYPGFVTFFNGTGQTVKIDDVGDLSAIGNVYGANIVGSYLYGCGSNVTGITTSNITGLAAVATSGNYGCLSGAPTCLNSFSNGPGYITSGDIPTCLSAFSNGPGYYTSGTSIPTTQITGLAIVATSGCYSSLNNLPPPPTLDSVTGAGSTTTNDISVGALAASTGTFDAIINNNLGSGQIVFGNVANVGIQCNSATLTTDGNNVSAGGSITAANFYTAGSGGNITGANIISATTFTATGDVYGCNVFGSYLHGCGANITGLPAGSSIHCGGSSVTFGALCGPVVMTTAGTQVASINQNSIAIGAYAGAASICSIAIGRAAGAVNQGAYAIAIGPNAGAACQHSCSIIINAVGCSPLNASNPGLYIDPIRCAGAAGGSPQIMGYCNTSKEIVFGISGATYGNADVETLLASGTITTDILTTGNVSATGNVTATTIATVGAPGNITGANVISTVTLTATGNVYGANIVSSYTLVSTPVTYSALTALDGARAFINDSNLAAAGNYGLQISGGGGNTAPVWSDGTNWYIG